MKQRIFIYIFLLVLSFNITLAQEADIAINNITLTPENPNIGDKLLFNYSAINFGPNITNISIFHELESPYDNIKYFYCCKELSVNNVFFIYNQTIINASGPHVLRIIINSSDGVLDSNLSNNKLVYIFTVKNVGQSSPIFAKINNKKLSPRQDLSGLEIVYLFITIILLILIFNNIKIICRKHRNK